MIARNTGLAGAGVNNSLILLTNVPTDCVHQSNSDISLATGLGKLLWNTTVFTKTDLVFCTIIQYRNSTFQCIPLILIWSSTVSASMSKLELDARPWKGKPYYGDAIASKKWISLFPSLKSLFSNIHSRLNKL